MGFWRPTHTHGFSNSARTFVANVISMTRKCFWKPSSHRAPCSWTPSYAPASVVSMCEPCGFGAFVLRCLRRVWTRLLSSPMSVSRTSWRSCAHAAESPVSPSSALQRMQHIECMSYVDTRSCHIPDSSSSPTNVWCQRVYAGKGIAERRFEFGVLRGDCDQARGSDCHTDHFPPRACRCSLCQADLADWTSCRAHRLLRHFSHYTPPEADGGESDISLRFTAPPSARGVLLAFPPYLRAGLLADFLRLQSGVNRRCSQQLGLPPAGCVHFAFLAHLRVGSVPQLLEFPPPFLALPAGCEPPLTPAALLLFFVVFYLHLQLGVNSRDFQPLLLYVSAYLVDTMPFGMSNAEIEASQSSQPSGKKRRGDDARGDGRAGDGAVVASGSIASSRADLQEFVAQVVRLSFRNVMDVTSKTFELTANMPLWSRRSIGLCRCVGHPFSGMRTR